MSLVAFHRFGAPGMRPPSPASVGGAPVAPGVIGQGVGLVRRHLGDELLAAGGGEAGGHPDVVQRAVVVVEAEQQRAHAVAALVGAVAGDHAVGGALVLHLQQGALVGHVRAVEVLGHHPVEAGALEAHEPVLGRGPVGGDRGEVHRGGGAGQRRLEPGAALGRGDGP